MDQIKKQHAAQESRDARNPDKNDQAVQLPIGNIGVDLSYQILKPGMAAHKIYDRIPEGQFNSLEKVGKHFFSFLIWMLSLS